MRSSAAIAFLYVFALGRRLAGPVCGFVAVFVLFVYRPAALRARPARQRHGRRRSSSAYCGGVYHYLAWAAAERQQRARGARHRGDAVLRARLHDEVRGQRLPADRPRWRRRCSHRADAATRRSPSGGCGRSWRSYRSSLIAPWFVYQYRLEGAGLFRVMFGEHVYARFTASLDPGHLHPWSFYYVTMFRQLGYSGTAWLAVAGGLVLLVNTVRRAVARQAARRLLVCDSGRADLDRHLQAAPLPVSVPAAGGAGGRVRSGVVAGRHATACGSGDGRRCIGGGSPLARGRPAVVNALLALAAIAALHRRSDARARPHRRRRSRTSRSFATRASSVRW